MVPIASELYKVGTKAVALIKHDRVDSPCGRILKHRQSGNHHKGCRDVHFVVADDFILRLVLKLTAVIAPAIDVVQGEEILRVLTEPLPQSVVCGELPVIPLKRKHRAASHNTLGKYAPTARLSPGDRARINYAKRIFGIKHA